MPRWPVDGLGAEDIEEEMMGMGNRLTDAHNLMEQTGCDLDEALKKLNWQETEIRRKEHGTEQVGIAAQAVRAAPDQQVTQAIQK